MRQVERRENGLFVTPMPEIPITKGKGTIDEITEGQKVTWLSVSFTSGSAQGAKTGFPVPQEHIGYFLKSLGLKSPTELKGAPVYLHHGGTGSGLYGISPPR